MMVRNLILAGANLQVKITKIFSPNILVKMDEIGIKTNILRSHSRSVSQL